MVSLEVATRIPIYLKRKLPSLNPIIALLSSPICPANSSHKHIRLGITDVKPRAFSKFPQTIHDQSHRSYITFGKKN